MKSILIIEDDESLSRGIAFAFEKDGYKIFTANSIKKGYDIFINSNVDLIILDLGLPDGNGIDFCKTVRKSSNVAILMLTACNMETDEVSGFLAGADDYVIKPFSLSVLRARVEALLRRSDNEKQTICVGEFTLDTGQCKLFSKQNEIPISTTEFKLLHYLMKNAGQVLTKEQILSALWDSSGNFVDENTLPVNISRLRAKIEADPKKPQTIKTVYGIGYIMTEQK